MLSENNVFQFQILKTNVVKLNKCVRVYVNSMQEIKNEIAYTSDAWKYQ